MHNYGLVLDWTIWSSPAFSQTGPDCSLRAPDRSVQSFYPSPFSSGRKTGLNGPVQYFWDRTAVQRYWTVRSSLFKRSPKKSTVRTGPDHGQSIPATASSDYPMSEHSDPFTVDIISNSFPLSIENEVSEEVNPFEHLELSLNKRYAIRRRETIEY